MSHSRPPIERTAGAPVREVDAVDLARFATPDGWPALTPDEMAQHRPDRSLAIVGDTVRTSVESPALRARCSLWWTDAPPMEGERLGAIGHFGASDAAAARALLDRACALLREQGCTIAVGPMDGNTWRRYRLVVDRGAEAPFFLEPANPPEWPAWWRDSGFRELAHYFSALNTDLSRRDPRAAEVRGRLEANGVRVRQLDVARFDAELARIHAVSRVAFRENYLYTPLPETAFAVQYQKVKPLVRPELVYIAEQGERPVGFAFSIPDAAEHLRGEPVRTVVVKTVAILPERQLLSGLGSLMIDMTHAAAHAMGFTRAIHALMHESNASRAISARTGATMRRYALFAHPLA